MSASLAWAALAVALSALAAVSVCDARRFRVPPAALALLLLAGGAWRILSGPAGGDPLSGAFWWPALWGAGLGAAVVLLPIAVAELLGRRWPILPGDAWLLASAGFVCGPLGLAWTLTAGSALALLHRACIQRRRGRPFGRGLTPLGPGLAAAAAGVLLVLEFGAAQAQKAPPPPLPATALAPAAPLLPGELAQREVRLTQRTPVPWPVLARRAAALGGFGARVEERPSRVADGAAELAPPPPMAVTFRGGYRELLDTLAARSGYAWGIRGRDLVWHRHWDVEWPPPPAAASYGKAVWEVDADRHGTVEAVLAEWAGIAGWTLVWKPRSEWVVAADATFEGTFVEAVDRLLAEGPIRSAVVPTAYADNRHLVIESAEGLR